jgi:hypothetical protein
MSLRNRIVVAVLLLTLVAPVAGWAKLTDRDPDGQQIKVATIHLDDAATARADVDGSLAPARTEAAAPQDGVALVFDRFQDWLRSLFAHSL